MDEDIYSMISQDKENLKPFNILDVSEPINNNLETIVLSQADYFLKKFDEVFKERNYDKSLSIANNYHQYIKDIEYYVIFNRFVKKGKKIIDKRIVKKTNGKDVVLWLDSSWTLGDEPEIILLPVNINLKFGIYIQHSIYFLELDIKEY